MRETYLQIILRFICDYIAENETPPSIREISSGCFLSRSTVIVHLEILEAKGWIERPRRKARSIRVLHKMCAEEEIRPGR